MTARRNPSRDTLVGLEDDVGGCTGTGFPDTFYTFTLTDPARVIVSVTDPSGITPRRYYLTLRADLCADGPSLACSSGTSMGTPATINAMLGAGTYTVIVESSDADASDYLIDYFEI